MRIGFGLFSLLLCSFAFAADAQFVLSQHGEAPAIVSENQVTMQLAGDLLARDFTSVLGASPARATDVASCQRVCVVIGRFDAALVRGIAQDEGIDLSGLAGKWETYERIALESKRHPGVKILLIAGSDLRGTVYGVIDLTRELGVSAWEWWADVKPARRTRIEVKAERIRSASPFVQYRGIFLNDEDWGLQPWAAKHDPSGDIGPATYARVFELLWRLKANIIWPAMHDSTKPFYQMAGNAQTAHDYAIVVGTSHAEPMMRNNVREWNKKERGEFNFFTNRDSLVRYWDERINEMKDFENVYSVGIRGIHDSAMEGAHNVDEARQGVTDAIAIQRELLSKALHKPAPQIPQALTLYKEVLGIYQAGLKVPEDVTLVWPDDNYGYLHELSTPDEAKRSGGAGIYYHLSYWGRPHDYLWLGTTHPALIREQLQRTAATGARKIWIVNVGDIKPDEYLMQYFLDLAFDRNAIDGDPRDHLVDWMRTQFGAAHAADIASIMVEYYNLAWERRPEFMGFNQTEPLAPIRQTDYLRSGGGEAEARLARYTTLKRRAEKMAAQLPPELQDAYFQTVLYPVRSSANLNARILHMDLATQGAACHVAQAKSAQAEIVADTARYNAMGNGKWQGMMDAAPRRLPVFAAPAFPADAGQPCAKSVSNIIPLDKIVTIPAKDATSHQGWSIVPGLGSFGASIRSDLAPTSHGTLSYTFSTVAHGPATLKLVAVPVHPLTSADKLRIDVSLDGAPFEVFDFATHGRSEEWKNNVLTNTAVRTQAHASVAAGRHQLVIRALDPGFILDRVELAFEGAPTYYGKPPGPIRLILVGDSTIAPGSGYGDALCARFRPEVKCVNLAQRGRSSGSFRSEGYWNEVERLLKDEGGFSQTYVLVQFGHNDQPGKGKHTTDLVTGFPANMARYAQEVRDLGGVPVLLTPLTRRTFKNGYLKDNLAPWAEATRRTAEAEHVALIDLNRISTDAVQAMGQAEADTLSPPPAPGSAMVALEQGAPKNAIDRTHVGAKGAALFSGMVAGELLRLIPSIKPYMAE